MKININLEQEFKNILRDFGTDFLILRTEGKLRCTCFDEVNQEVSRTCPICLGLGYSFVAEKHTMRSENSMLTAQMNSVLKQEDIGNVITGHKKFYALPTTAATERDLIIEVDWDAFGKPVYNGGPMWKVTNIDSTQNLGQGKDIFKIYYASITPIRRKIRGIRLSELQGVKQYNILMEG